MKILLDGIDIITSDIDNMVIKNGYIAIEDQIIKKVTTDKSELKSFIPDKIMNGKNKLAMPGLVNAHTHSPMTILRNYANDLALEDWLFNNIFPIESKLNKEDIYWGSMLGIAEMIKTGTTSFADMYYHVEQTAKVVKDTGIRANLSMSAYSFIFENGAPKFIDNTKLFEDFYKTYNGAFNDRLKSYVLVHSPYIYDMTSMTDSANVAKNIGTGIHIHVLETRKERKDTFEKYRESAVFACAKAGIFDVPCISAHCVHLNDEDIKLLKEKGVNIAHNPTSNLKLGSGIARIPDMHNIGLNIGLGTDGAASNNNLDMFEELNLTALIHKGANQNPLMVKAEEAFIMATYGGSKAIGFGNDVGKIKENMKADITILDIDNLHYVPYNNPVSSVVYSGQASDVDTVIIDGNIVYENKEFKTMDIEEVKSKVKDIYKRVSI